MNRALLAAAAALLLAACNLRPPISTRLTLQFVDDEHVRITGTAPNDDELAGRFAVADPEEERIVIEKRRGAVHSAEHSGTIERFALQRFFTDVPATFKFERGEGWSELAIYPGASTRATRPQREHVANALHGWSIDAASYVDTMSQLYRYIDANPQRAAAVFRLLLVDTDQQSTIAEEQALIGAAGEALDRMRDRVERARGEAETLVTEVDLVYNPFPHDITIRTPREIVSVENFDQRNSDSVAIKRVTAIEAATSLAEKWISPDPLSMMLHDERVPIEDLAARPRRSASVVTPQEIEKAFVEKLTPASVYRVRWIDTR